MKEGDSQYMGVGMCCMLLRLHNSLSCSSCWQPGHPRTYICICIIHDTYYIPVHGTYVLYWRITRADLTTHTQAGAMVKEQVKEEAGLSSIRGGNGHIPRAGGWARSGSWYLLGLYGLIDCSRYYVELLIGGR